MKSRRDAVLEFRLSKKLMEGDLGDFPGPVRLIKVDETKWEPLWDRLVREHHYLGYDSVIGSRVKYLIALGNKIVGAISFCSAAYKLGLRDKFVGWDEPTRLAMLPRLVSNNRFLLLPWVRIRNLASHVLSRSLEQLRVDWKRWYGVEPYMAETFVDSERFAGTCYAAANWIRLGATKGYGRQGNRFVFHGHPKDLYVKVMSRRFTSAFHPNIDRLLVDEMQELLVMMLSDTKFYARDLLERMGLTGVTQGMITAWLSEHLLTYLPFLHRKELVKHFTAMIQGMLGDVNRKTIEGICAEILGIDEYRNLANFMTRSVWDNEGMLKAYAQDAGDVLFEPRGMVTIDATSFSKSGKCSVGVDRQYLGCEGKVDNGQVGVIVGYAGKEGSGGLDYRLYLGKKWHSEEYADMRAKCAVPEDLKFETSNQIALELLQGVLSLEGFKGRYIGVDGAYGRDHAFLDGIPEGYVYYADVPCDTKVFYGRPETLSPEYGGRGRKPTRLVLSFQPFSVRELAKREDLPWAETVLGMGSEGPILAKDKCLRVVESRDGQPGKDVWLHIRELGDGSLKYSLCNESAEASIEDIRYPSRMRWSIEEFFRDCKEHLGMDHYKLRSWHGWRRHMLLTFISHLFITKMRRRFGVKIEEPGPGPCVMAPVPTADYVDAVTDMKNGREISHPNIQAYPDRVQYLLTFGNIKLILKKVIVLFGNLMDKINHDLKSCYAKYTSGTNRKVAKLVSPEGG